MEDDFDILQNIFIEEAWKSINKIELIIKIGINSNSFDIDEINELFRVVHGLKGSASMMGYMAIAQAAHSTEELYIYIRRNKCSDDDIKTIINLTIEVTQYLRKEILNIEKTGVTDSDFGYEYNKKIYQFLVGSYKKTDIICDSNKFEKDEQVGINKKVSFSTLATKVRRITQIMQREVDKIINLELSGFDISVDCDIYDKVSMAVLQMVKNSIDHGIETSEERIKKEKLSSGRISISINSDDNNIYVEVSDDGIGIDKEKIISTAIERGIIKYEDIDNYSDSEIYYLVFKPGFTTKRKASLFSGRGIGLDAVNAAISALGGTVDIKSIYGQGCKFFIKIPLY